MRTFSWIPAAAAAVALTGCVSYPVYQPMPIARLSPAQTAALANRPIDPVDKARYAQDEASVQQGDQADIATQSAVPYAYAYGYPATPYYDYGSPYYAGSYPFYGGGYPYYGGLYPFGGLSLSFGFRGGYGGYRGGYGGYRGGYGGHRGYGGHGGYGGHRGGGGGFHGHR